MVPQSPHGFGQLSPGRSEAVGIYRVRGCNVTVMAVPFFSLTVDSNPEWSKGEQLPQDWIDFVAGVIERSRKVREHIEAAPHQLENA